MKIWFFHKDLNVEDQGDQKQLVLCINHTLSLIISFISSFISLVNRRETSPETFSTGFCIYVFWGKKTPNQSKTKKLNQTTKQHA